MSELFIRRPIFASVISIVIMIAGIVSMLVLPIARYPEIAPPTITVTATYPGADAATVGEAVAAVLESEINGVEGMLYLGSVSSSDGIASITVTFRVGTDLDLAQVFVQNRVAAAEPKLPEEVVRQGISVKKKSTDIAMLIGLTGRVEAFDSLTLSNFARLRLRDEILRVPGVGEVTIFGAEDYGMRIWLDPDALQARGLTVAEVLSAVRRQNVQVAAGRIGAPPVPDGQQTEYIVSVRGRLADAEEFGRIVVASGDGSRVVRLSDVARIELGARTYAQSSTLGGEPSAVLSVYQLPGSNAIAVVEGVSALLDRLEAEGTFPPSVRQRIIYRSTDVITASIREVVITLVVAVVLVIATVFVFLQSWRATLIPAATIPVSLVGTFAVMLAAGFSINLLTLFGLVLAIGIVVDDAIVVVENTTRHLDESGLSPRDAAIRSMREVTTPVIATTLVLLAVFVPTAFMPGLAGQLFRQFALTIAIATVFSSINALTLSPALAGLLLRPTPRRPALPFRLFNAGLGAVTGVYGRLIRLLIRLAPLTAAVFAAVVAAAFFGLGRVPAGFIPQEDEGWALAAVQLPEGATLERTRAITERIAAAAGEVPGVADVVAISGFSILDNASLSNAGTLFVIFDNWALRTTPDRSQAAIIGAINRIGAGEIDARTFAFPLPSLPGMGTSAGLAGFIQDRSGAGMVAVQQAAQAAAVAAAGQSGLAGGFSTFRATTPTLRLDIDRDAVESRNIPLSAVFDSIGATLGGSYVNDFVLAGRTFQVRLQGDAPFRTGPADIERLEVRTPSGGMLPLGAILSIEETVSPAVVPRYNVYPAAKFMVQPAPGTTSGEAIALTEALMADTLPPGFGFQWTELAFQAASAGSPLPVFILAVVLVYLVLAAQYESWALPLSVLLGIPTALLGAAAALLLAALDANLYTQIGIVLLLGLSAKSSILIVEFAAERRRAGDTASAAAVSASTLRFRAILMTAFSFILGVLPLLIATGAGAESRRTIGATAFGGMLAGTILSVIFVPVLYCLVDWTFNRRRAPSADPPA